MKELNFTEPVFFSKFSGLPSFGQLAHDIY